MDYKAYRDTDGEIKKDVVRRINSVLSFNGQGVLDAAEADFAITYLKALAQQPFEALSDREHDFVTDGFAQAAHAGNHVMTQRIAQEIPEMVGVNTLEKLTEFSALSPLSSSMHAYILAVLQKRHPHSPVLIAKGIKPPMRLSFGRLFKKTPKLPVTPITAFRSATGEPHRKNVCDRIDKILSRNSWGDRSDISREDRDFMIQYFGVVQQTPKDIRSRYENSIIYGVFRTAASSGHLRLAARILKTFPGEIPTSRLTPYTTEDAVPKRITGRGEKLDVFMTVLDAEMRKRAPA